MSKDAIQSAAQHIRDGVNAAEKQLMDQHGYDYPQARRTIQQTMIELGDRQRLAAGRQLWLVQGRVHGDDDDCSQVIEAGSREEALRDLKTDLACATLGFDSLDDYEQREKSGQLPAHQSIILIGAQPVFNPQ